MPILLLPGILGTRLQIEIDCEVLRDKNKAVFEECGWNSCDYSNSTGLIDRLLGRQRVPKKEYSLWMPKINTPMSYLGLTYNQSKCFSSLMQLRIVDN